MEIKNSTRIIEVAISLFIALAVMAVFIWMSTTGNNFATQFLDSVYKTTSQETIVDRILAQTSEIPVVVVHKAINITAPDKDVKVTGTIGTDIINNRLQLSNYFEYKISYTYNKVTNTLTINTWSK